MNYLAVFCVVVIANIATYLVLPPSGPWARLALWMKTQEEINRRLIHTLVEPKK